MPSRKPRSGWTRCWRSSPYEIELGVDTLCVDSTSFRQLAESSDHDPVKVGEAIARIVSERGKLHNPVTGSGGILTGTVHAVGEDYRDPPAVGARIVTLVSLTLTPLRLQAVGHVDVDSPHVPVTGTAFLPWTAPWTMYPDDIPFDAALAALDVCNAASQTRSLIDAGTRTVLVLGGGHAGLLALRCGAGFAVQWRTPGPDRRRRAHLPAGPELELCDHRHLHRPP